MMTDKLKDRLMEKNFGASEAGGGILGIMFVSGAKLLREHPLAAISV
jgi:hypothetical protein